RPKRRLCSRSPPGRAGPGRRRQRRSKSVSCSWKGSSFLLSFQNQDAGVCSQDGPRRAFLCVLCGAVILNTNGPAPKLRPPPQNPTVFPGERQTGRLDIPARLLSTKHRKVAGGQTVVI